MLHELVWTIDASQHAIITVDEINEALAQVSGFTIKRVGDLVELIPDSNSGQQTITDEDMSKAILLYQRTISGAV